MGTEGRGAARWPALTWGPWARVLGSLALLTLTAVLARAAEPGCVRGALAPGFCDADGDGVADSPADPKQWLSPTPLVLGAVEVGGPVTGVTGRRPDIEYLRQHLERVLGQRVIYFIARDTAELIAAFKTGKAHLAVFNTGTVAQAVQCFGFVPLAQPVDGEGRLDGYKLEFVVPAGSPIQRLADLKGHRLTLVDAYSASGAKLPKAILGKRFGWQEGRDYQVEYSGRHDISVIGLANGLYEVAAVASSVRERMIRDRVVEGSSLRVLEVGGALPRPPWGVSHRVRPDWRKRIQAALLSYSGPFGHEDRVQLRVARYAQDWAGVRELGAVETCAVGR